MINSLAAEHTICHLQTWPLQTTQSSSNRKLSCVLTTASTFPSGSLASVQHDHSFSKERSEINPHLCDERIDHFPSTTRSTRRSAAGRECAIAARHWIRMTFLFSGLTTISNEKLVSHSTT